jgi:hypothetical protein
MIEVTVEIIDSVLEVEVEFPKVGLIITGIDEGTSSTTTYPYSIVEL